MNKSILSASVLSGLLLVGCGAEKAEPEAAVVELETLEEKVSYLIGYNQAAELKGQGLDLQETPYLEGVKQFMAGAEPTFSPEEAQQIFTEFQQKMQEAAQKEFEAAGAENAVKSEAFLAENAGKEGVVTTESGLQYKILEAGDGEKPGADSTVQVHYEGSLITGEVFDSSVARGAPVEFGLTQVIPGWTEALQLMPEGSKWELYIPAELAYGANGPASIGPNQALIFEVELLQANFTAE